MIKKIFLILFCLMFCRLCNAEAKAMPADKIMLNFFEDATCGAWNDLDKAAVTQDEQGIIDMIKLTYIMAVIDHTYVMCELYEDDSAYCEMPFRYGQYKIEVDVACQDREVRDVYVAAVLFAANIRMINDTY